MGLLCQQIMLRLAVLAALVGGANAGCCMPKTGFPHRGPDGDSCPIWGIFDQKWGGCKCDFMFESTCVAKGCHFDQENCPKGDGQKPAPTCTFCDIDYKPPQAYHVADTSKEEEP